MRRMEPAGSLVIVNPNASQVRDAATRAAVVAEVERAVARRDGVAPRVVVTGTEADTRPAVEAALAQGVRAVIGVGGDGTLRDIAELLLGSGVPLGIVAAGTGNQLAAVLGLPLTAASAAAALVGARTRTIDLGEVTLRLVDAPEWRSVFTIGCGAGFDARLMATTPRRLEAAHRQGRLLRAGAQAGRDHRRGALSPHGGRRVLRDGGLGRAGRQHGPARAGHARTCACRCDRTTACWTSSSSARAGRSTA